MARRDGTGPLGMGPLTGRGLGPCGRGYYSYRIPRLGLGYGRGYGLGYGYGRGYGLGYGLGYGYGRRGGLGYGRGLRNYGSYEPYPYEPYPVDENTETDYIEEEKAILEARLRDINKILDSLKNEDE